MTARRLTILSLALGLIFALAQASRTATTPVTVAGPCFELAALAAIGVGVRRHRPAFRLPWLLLAAGMFMNLSGVATFYAGGIFGFPVGSPGPVDLLFLAYYPLTAAALIAWQVRRSRGRDRVAAIDVTIVVAALGTLAWMTLVMPSLSTPGHSTGQVVIAALYPYGDLAIIATAVRVLLGSSRVPPALGLLVACLGCLLINDIGYAVNTVYLDDLPSVTVLVTSIGLPAYGLAGAAALHPSMVELEKPDTGPSVASTRGRLILLAAAFLLAPISQIISYETGAVRFVPIYASLSMVLSVLVLARMWLMVGEQRRLATTDGLTGLHSRRYFEQALTDASVRRAGVVGVLLVDVDHFKQINDRYGHAVGDAVLRELAQRLSAAIRPQDVVARYGGEEFAVLLQDVTDESARLVAERVRAAVADTPMPTGTGTSIPVTISIGVCTQPATEGMGDQVMLRADRSLYVAKDHGRNQVVVAG